MKVPVLVGGQRRLGGSRMAWCWIAGAAVPGGRKEILGVD